MVSPRIREIVDELDAIANELFLVIKQSEPRNKIKTEGKPKINRRANLTSYDDIFDTKMTFITESIDPSPKAVMEVIAKSVLKTLVEFLRINAYEVGDFHQVQVDLNFYSQHLWEYLVDSTKLIRFTLRSAATSCEFHTGTQPIPMDENSVHSIAIKVL